MTVTTELSKITPIFQSYMEALNNSDFVKASETIQDALWHGLSHSQIYDQVFAPALREVGRRWETGAMTIAQEHLSTGITEYCRTVLLSVPAYHPSQTTGRVLLSNVSSNHHTLGINLLSDVFRLSGWQVFPLITQTPEEQVAKAAHHYNVDLVCLSIALPAQFPKAATTIRALRQSKWSGLIEVGGSAFYDNEDAIKLTGGDFLGLDAGSTVEMASRLLAARQHSTGALG